MRARTLVPLAACAAGAIGCRSPTQIDVVVSTNVPCASVSGTALTAGALGEIEGIPPTSTTESCSGGYIGSVVLVPSGSDDSLVAVKVVTSINGTDVNECMPDDAGSYGQDCIVARRALHYLPYTPLQVDVLMSGACAGKACNAESTCVEGACVPATIGNPAACEGSGCSEQVLEDGGVSPPVDSGLDATLSDASLPPPDSSSPSESGGPADAAGGDGEPGDAGSDSAVIGCDLGGLQPGAPWAMSGYCPTRRNRSPLLGPTSTPSFLWRYPSTGTLNGRVLSGPAVGADGTIYVALQTDVVDAIRPDGTLLWEQQAPLPLDAGEGFLAQPVLAADQTLRVIEFDRGAYTVFPLDGGPFSQIVGGEALASQSGIVIRSGGDQYFGDVDGHLITLGSAGQVVADLAGYSDESDRLAITAAGRIFSSASGGGGGGLFETNTAGSLVWQWPITISDHIRGETIANDGTIRAYYQSLQSVLALDPTQVDAQAALMWQVTFDANPGIEGFAIDDEGTTYLGGDGAGLLAFDSGGHPVGTASYGTCSAPVLDAAENVYALCDDYVVSYSRGLASSNWGIGFSFEPYLDPNVNYWGVLDTIVIGAGGALYFTVDETLNDGSNVDIVVALGPP